MKDSAAELASLRALESIDDECDLLRHGADDGEHENPSALLLRIAMLQ
jgi:hypothetical protein